MCLNHKLHDMSEAVVQNDPWFTYSSSALMATAA